MRHYTLKCMAHTKVFFGGEVKNVHVHVWHIQT